MIAGIPILDYARPLPLLRRRWFLRFLIACAIAIAIGIAFVNHYHTTPVATPRLVPVPFQKRRAAFDGGWTNFSPSSYPLLSPQEQRYSFTPPVLSIPAGCVNLALDKPVSCRDPVDIDIGQLSLVTDGDIAGNDGSWVQLTGGQPQWIQIDLKASCPLYAIAIWRAQTDPHPYRDMIVQVSDDPNFQRRVCTLFNNDHDNSTGLGKGADFEYIEHEEWPKLIDAKGIRARYIRCYSNGSQSDGLNRYAEVEVFGLPATPK